MKFQGFTEPAYKLLTVNMDCQECINLYLEKDELGTGKNGEPAYLTGTPGLETVAVSPNGEPWRGLFLASNGMLYGVAGAKVYSITSGWVITELVQSGGGAFTLNSSTGLVQFADSGAYVVFSHSSTANSGSLGQIKLSDSTVGTTDIEAAGLYRAYSIDFKNSRFLVSGYWSTTTDDNGQGRFMFSELITISPVPAWNALYVLTAGSNPDPVVQIKVAMDYVWIGGSKTTEVWQVSSNADAPYTQIQGSLIDIGILGKTMSRVSAGLAFLGQQNGGPQVFAAVGSLTPQRISDHALEAALSSYGDVPDAFALSYQERGHHFYMLSFPTQGETWVYDFAVGGWHQRKSFDYSPTDGGILSRHRGNCLALAYGGPVVGDYLNGNLYKMREDHYTDGGLPILRQRTSPHVASDLERLFFSKFQVDCEFGVGLDGVGQGTDPVIQYQYSNDGGHSWSNWRDAYLGKVGQYTARAIWRMLGSGRDRVHRIRMSDPVPFRMIGCDMEVTR